MKKGFYNGNIIDSKELSIDLNDRALCYGDGLFETMICENGEIRLKTYHSQRLTKGIKILQIEADIESAFEAVPLLTDQQVNRVRLQIWRKSGGFYTPISNSANVLITASPFNFSSQNIKSKADYSQQVRLYPSLLSSLKTLNALHYVIAGLERKARSLDEIIILDNEGNVSECSSSNIFWKIENTYFTPSLDCGCIDGVMRKHIITSLEQLGIAIIQGKYTPNELKKADEVFTTNVTGISAIEKIGKSIYSTNLSITPLLEL